MKSVFKILGMFLLLGALAGGVYLASKNQETRRGAAANDTAISFLSASNSYGAGVTVPIVVVIDTGKSTDLLNSAEIYVDFDRTKLKYLKAEVLAPTYTLAQTESDIDKGSGPLSLTPLTGSSEVGGAVQILKIYFSSIASGQAGVRMKTGALLVEGRSTLWDIVTNNGITLTIGGNTPTATIAPTVTVAPTSTVVPTNTGVPPTATIAPTVTVAPTVTIAPTPTLPPAGTTSILNFKMSFSGVTQGAQCANWSVQVMMRGADGTTKTYNDVSLTNTGEAKNGLAVYKSSLSLDGFNQTDNLAVFIKGPKHLQSKYGKDNQTDFYGLPGGELGGLTKDVNTSPTFDFSGYPLSAGDMTRYIEDKEPGVVDGRDFSYIKSEVVKRSSVDPGQDLPADLNGNCAYESQDTALFMLALKDKQEQLY